FTQRNKIANFNYVLLDYASIDDKDIKLSEEDYKSYYNEHKGAFYNPTEARTIEYVVFNAQPSAGDSLAVKEKAARLAQEFAVAENDSLFATINSETKHPVTYYTKGSLPGGLDSAAFNATSG